MEGFETGARSVAEVHIPSLEYRIQRSRAKKESQEEQWPAFTCATINHKSIRKSSTFTNVISNDKDKPSPSAENSGLHMANRKDDNEKEKLASSNKEETIVTSEVTSTGPESSEMEITLNEFADSPQTCMAEPQNNRDVAERFHIPEVLAGQKKPVEFDKTCKPESPDFQQARRADVQAKPVKDLQNGNIQNITVKRLREIQFSPTTFKRRTLSTTNMNIREQNIFSRIVSLGAECKAEEIPTLPDNQRYKLEMELPESYHIDLTAQENSGTPKEQTTSSVEGQKSSSSQHSLLFKLPAESTCTETKVKEECSGEKVAEGRELHYYYDVKEEIGRGSYSFVKRVVNKQNGRHCAAKFVTLRRDIKAYEELAILSGLNHSKIARLLDMFETKGTLVLVLEMCSNEGLLDHLFKKKSVAEAEVRNYIQQILEGVHYLHDNNILHLDINPANILMVHPERDDIKICDFGFAQELSWDKLQFSKYGCPEFVAPEIISQHPISTATDICLTGSCPFVGENDRITLLNVRKGSFSWNEHDLDCITEDAQSFVKKVIQLTPEDRPTASECLNDRWFQEKQKLQEPCTINTKRLKFFLSRNKWQHSLMCYKSILAMRSIPQLLEESSEVPSLGMPRHFLKQSNSSTCSASSSDFEVCSQEAELGLYHTSDISQVLFHQYFADGGDHCETQEAVSFPTNILAPAVLELKRHKSASTGSIAVEKQADIKHQTYARYDENNVKAPSNTPEIHEDLPLNAIRMKHSIAKEISELVTRNLTRAISADNVFTLQVLKKDSLPDSNYKPPSKLLLSHCFVKNTSSSDTLENRDLPSENLQNATNFERIGMCSGYTKGRLHQPHLDCSQVAVQERTVNDKRCEETSSHIPGKQYKSASCNNEDKVAYVPNGKLEKSKSFDEYEREFVVQTTSEYTSELMNPCLQHSDPHSNTTVVDEPMITLPISAGEQVSGSQKSALSDTMCLSEDVLESPTKNTSSELDQSLQTDALESLEKEQGVNLEKKPSITDIKEYNSEGNLGAVASLQHLLDLQNKDCKFSRSCEAAESSSLFEPSEVESKTEKRQDDEKPISSHSSVSGIRSSDVNGSMDSELQSKISYSATSVVTNEPQPQSSRENITSSYYDAVEPVADYFDRSEPHRCELHYERCPSFLKEEFKEKRISQAQSLPEEVNKDNPPRGKLYQTPTTSYELLCNEIEPESESLRGMTANEWESDLLELLEGSEEDEIMSDMEEGESKRKRKSKRISLENKIYQSFESLRKAFKSQKDASAPISSSEMSLIVGESHSDPSLKSASKTFGGSGLLRLLSRSASLNWDKGFHDGDGGGSRHSLSAIQERGKSQTLPARFSWQSLKSKDSAERLELRKKKHQLTKVHRSAKSSKMESSGSQNMERMKAPLIRSFKPHNKDLEIQQMGTCTGDTSDNPTDSLKIKSRLFSFKLPGSRAKEKAPSFTEQLQNQSVVLSQSVTLYCRASGYPNPKILWYKDNQLMCCGDRILSSITSTNCQLLTILNVAKEDLGSYKCVAENHLGKAATCCILNLAVLPCCPDSPEVAQVFEDGALVIWKPLVSRMPITYIVECQKKGEDWKTIASDLSETCFYASELCRGEAYLYRVAYVNKAGKGPFSHPSVEIIIGETEMQSHSVHGEKPASMQQTYTFLAEINRGRFSIIKKCIENSTGKLLAAKINPYKKQRKPFVVKEYETLKKLYHNNIVQLHGAYITPKYFVLIQEFCEGKELLHYLAERSCYSEKHVVELLTQMLCAVEYLHLNHILHLDLRSENMIIVEHNILKLLNFGKAEIHMPGRPLLVEKCRDFVENMAPEILEGKPVVPGTDIWAVGVVTFTMLSGDCPFRSDKHCDKEKNIRKGKIKFGRCYSSLSQGAVSFLKSTLCLNPVGRLCSSECRSFAWFQEETMMKLSSSTVSFETAKLRNYLKQREKQRMLLCIKHEVLILQ